MYVNGGLVKERRKLVHSFFTSTDSITTFELDNLIVDYILMIGVTIKSNRG
jgi:hypothetical protein